MRAESPAAVARRAAVLAALAAAVLWGTIGTAQELGAPTAAPATVAGVRSLGGGVLLVLVLLAAGRGPRVRAAVVGAPVALLGAAAAITVFQLGYLTAVRSVGVALGTLVAIGTAPMAAGLYAALAGRPPGRRWVVATIATVAGAGALLLGGGASGAGQDPGAFGIGAGLVAGAAYGTYTTVSGRILATGADGASTVAVTFVLAGLLLTPVLIAGDLGWVVTAPGAATAAWLVVGTTALGYVLFARGLAGLDAPTVTTLTLAEPLAATILAVALVGERLDPLSWVGAGGLVLGLVLVAAPRRRGGARPQRRLSHR